jgi:hypothetical protein
MHNKVVAGDPTPVLCYYLNIPKELFPAGKITNSKPEIKGRSSFVDLLSIPDEFSRKYDPEITIFLLPVNANRYRWKIYLLFHHIH